MTYGEENNVVEKCYLYNFLLKIIEKKQIIQWLNFVLSYNGDILVNVPKFMLIGWLKLNISV